MNGTISGNALKLVTFLMGQDKDKIWDLKPHRKKKTRSQNGYYWELLTETANVLRMSKPEMHNRMLRRYGQPLIIDGDMLSTYLADTEEMERQVLQSEECHLRPTQTIIPNKNGEMVRAYIYIRGCRTYDIREMSILLDGMVQEAQAQGIETLTPAQLAEMRLYEEKHHKNK